MHSAVELDEFNEENVEVDGENNSDDDDDDDDEDIETKNTILSMLMTLVCLWSLSPQVHQPLAH